MDSLKYSFSSGILFLVLVVRLFKKRQTSRNGLGSIVILSLVAFPLLVFGLEIIFNAWLNFSAPTAHTVRVVDKRSGRSYRAGRTYSVELESWRREGEVEEIDLSPFLVDETTFEGIIPNRTRITVTTKPGRFGFEWVKSYKIEL